MVRARYSSRAGNSNELSVASAAAHSLSPTKVGPQMSTSVLVVYDKDTNGFGGATDMVGPEIGSVKFTQGALGALTLTLHTDFAQPNITYNISLTCGPSHALACGFITQGTLTTNATGVGNVSDTFTLATLRGASFGCGYRTDHVDLIGGPLSVFLPQVRLTILFLVRRGRAPTMPTGQGDPTGK